jgi:hypothetical protein
MFWLAFFSAPLFVAVFDLVAEGVLLFWLPQPLQIAMEVDSRDRMDRKRRGIQESGIVILHTIHPYLTTVRGGGYKSQV